MRTRLQDNIIKLKRFPNDTILEKKGFTYIVHQEPTNYMQARVHNEWRQAMEDE